MTSALAASAPPAASAAAIAGCYRLRAGPGLLVALVVGSILGSGIFGLPQNLAKVVRELQADVLVIATDVDAVALDWSLPTQRAIGSLEQLEALLAGTVGTQVMLP